MLVEQFIEKPQIEIAKSLLMSESYLWNAGIFLFRAKDIVAAFKTHAPHILALVNESVEQAQIDLGFLRLAADPWCLCENISLDFSIMEKIKNLAAVPYAGGWNDLGGWDAVWLEQKPDPDGVVSSENSVAIDCKDVLLRSEQSSLQLVGLGLENVIVIAMPDAVLVAGKDRSQDIKLAVTALKDKGKQQAESF